MARTFLLLLLKLVISVCLVNVVAAIDDECKHNTFNVTGNHMQFIKEVANAEFAINGMFKGLHCCAKGYRSIEWLKDNQPYPWQSASSGLILYPESVNQTIYTQRVTPEDAGNYTCIVRNDTDYYVHTITLKVYDKAPDEPQLTYVSEDTEVSVGHDLRLFCEAFVGALDHLPDAYNDAYWARILSNGTEVRDKHTQKVSREDEQCAGALLNIQEVTADTFGRYVCVIKKPGKDIRQYVRVTERACVEYLSPSSTSFTHLVFWALVTIVMLCVTSFVLYKRFGLKLRVKFKDRFGNLEHNDGKNVDVLIAYTAPDKAFTLETLLPTLERTFNYACESHELPRNISLWAPDLLEAAKKSRRLVAVLSPESVQGQWDPPTLYEALKQLNSLNAQFTCVMMADAPKNTNETKNDLGETFVSLFKQIVHVQWTGVEHNEQFWLTLRLYLPPKQVYSDEASNAKRLNGTEDELV